MQRLYAYQHYDNGWGWWTGDESNVYMTAYVLHGLMETQRAGFTVDQDAISRGISFLREHLSTVSGREGRSQANRLAYILYVLAEYNHETGEGQSSYELGLAINLFEKRHRLDNYGLGVLAMALKLLDPEEETRVNTLMADLVGLAVPSAAGTHWQEGEPDYENMNTDVRTTGTVLWALSRLQPKSELLPHIVRWLMAGRNEGHWQTTQETAWSLMGLVAYMRASGEMQADYSYAVYLNDKEIGSGDMTRETLAETRRLRLDVAQLLVEESNRLVIDRPLPRADQSGQGQLYYTAFLRYFLPADQVQAQNRGIYVTRQYSPVDNPDVPVSSAAVGDLVHVKVSIVVPNDLYYVIVEDPLPAGCEAVDYGLKTTSVVGERPQLRNLTAEEEWHWYRYYGWGWWWWSHTEIRDEKVALFASYLPRGTYEYTYLMRASVPGEYLVLPTTAAEMYFPDISGRGEGGRFVVTE